MGYLAFRCLSSTQTFARPRCPNPGGALNLSRRLQPHGLQPQCQPLLTCIVTCCTASTLRAYSALLAYTELGDCRKRLVGSRQTRDAGQCAPDLPWRSHSATAYRVLRQPLTGPTPRSLQDRSGALQTIVPPPHFVAPASRPPQPFLPFLPWTLPHLVHPHTSFFFTSHQDHRISIHHRRLHPRRRFKCS